ncbi:MAG: hypothetical protein RPU15_17220 [Candidatus Sedimenticola sp. (ex Thyasira tokunagai)]
MNKILDIIIPRFLVEDVAVLEVGDEYQPVCCVKDLQPGDHYDKIITVRTLNLFGFGVFPKLIDVKTDQTVTPA